jgi:hypothetical protein
MSGGIDGFTERKNKRNTKHFRTVPTNHRYIESDVENFEPPQPPTEISLNILPPKKKRVEGRANISEI